MNPALMGAYLAAAALIAWLSLLAANGGRGAIRRAVRVIPGLSPRILPKVIAIVEPAGVVGLIAVWAWLTLHRPFRVDATVYWAIDLQNLYGSSVVNQVGAYLYSPVFAQVAEPFTALPWTVWYSGWAAINLALLARMLGPAAALVTLAFPAVSHALWSGNIHFLMAAAAVVAVRWPPAWAFPLLTKVTPGVSILWLAGRRDFHGMSIALLSTAAVAGVSFLVAPHLWREWISLLGASSQVPDPVTLLPLPLPIRLAIAGAVALLGGKKGWAWTIPIAMVVAQPLFWTAGLAALVAIVPLAGSGRSARRSSADEAGEQQALWEAAQGD